MLIVGAVLLVNQQLNVGQFIAAEIVILIVINSVEKLIINLDNVYDVLTSVDKLSKIIEKPQEADGTLAPPVGNGFALRALSLSFSHPDHNRPTLQELDFSVAAGEKVCIMGPPGSGKSTLVRLIAGLYVPDEGSLLLGEVPLQRYDCTALRARIGLMLEGQDIVEGTLLDNIAMGDEEVDIARLEPLVETIGLQPFVHAHQDGYSMELQPEGTRLSPRIIRQVALLRALAYQHQLLLLEDPWTDLDEAAVQRIQQHLLQNTNGATVIVATNNTGYALQCDKVILLSENGRLVATGRPQEYTHLINRHRKDEGN
jgi:ABC-type bacteriocin/lantibiotic exporter with double-glycine peptidase domain